MIKRLSHLLIYVSNVQSSVDFYVGKLGLQVIYEEGDYVRVGGQGFHLGLHQAYSSEQVGARGIELQFLVDDVDAFYKTLSKEGVKFSHAPGDMPWNARHAFLEDPDGYKISIYSSLR